MTATPRRWPHPIRSLPITILKTALTISWTIKRWKKQEAAAQGYVAGTMEEDGFAYDGAAVYDAETHQCLRVYGDYPDEKAQEQAVAFALEHDTAQQNAAELPAFLDMHLIEANLLTTAGASTSDRRFLNTFKRTRALRNARSS